MPSAAIAPPTLVIPGKNAERTLARCLDAAVPLLERGELAEIVFVDDASTDRTAEILERYPVRRLAGRGAGPGAARNVGWRAATSEWIWCIDSDCVAEPEALARLVTRVAPDVGAVGGSYGNELPGSLLASLIHEEIVVRHAAMPEQVDFLGSFNVLYRRAALARVGGFDETLVTAEDADLSYRLRAAGYALAFEAGSRVGHYHPDRLLPYLRTQARHGYWRLRLYLTHREKSLGDSYTSLADLLQGPLAMAVLAALPALAWRPLAWVWPLLVGLLAALQLPMTARVVASGGRARYAVFAGLGFVRAFARALGMTRGAFAALAGRLRGRA